MPERTGMPEPIRKTWLPAVARPAAVGCAAGVAAAGAVVGAAAGAVVGAAAGAVVAAGAGAVVVGAAGAAGTGVGVSAGAEHACNSAPPPTPTIKAALRLRNELRV